MTRARFEGYAYNPDQAVKMILAYDAACRELQTAGEAFDREALATVIILLEKTPQADAGSLARRAVDLTREETRRCA